MARLQAPGELRALVKHLDEFALYCSLDDLEQVFSKLGAGANLEPPSVLYGSANTFSVNPETIATYCFPSLPS